MSTEAVDLREFVGFVWPAEDFSDQVGLLVLAADVAEAGSVARETYGAAFRVSLWNLEDAARPR